jgi:hypothetical protein
MKSHLAGKSPSSHAPRAPCITWTGLVNQASPNTRLNLNTHTANRLNKGQRRGCQYTSSCQRYGNGPDSRACGLPLWATALSPEPEPWGRTQPRPATPAPKPRPTSPSAFQQNTRTRKMTRERNISCTQPSRQPNAGGATDAQTPTPPAACDRSALSAL